MGPVGSSLYGAGLRSSFMRSAEVLRSFQAIVP
nr:MAG TPA: hypothetical protein [Caudoviricetes sp.]